jgi:hypothetical protein
MPLTIAPKRIKYLETNLIKEIKDKHTKNTLMKEILKNRNEKVSHSCGLEELILLK